MLNQAKFTEAFKSSCKIGSFQHVIPCRSDLALRMACRRHLPIKMDFDFAHLVVVQTSLAPNAQNTQPQVLLENTRHASLSAGHGPRPLCVSSATLTTAVCRMGPRSHRREGNTEEWLSQGHATARVDLNPYLNLKSKPAEPHLLP